MPPLLILAEAARHSGEAAKRGRSRGARYPAPLPVHAPTLPPHPSVTPQQLGRVGPAGVQGGSEGGGEGDGAEHQDDGGDHPHVEH